MAQRISDDECERLNKSGGRSGLVDVRGEHAARVAGALSAKYPGIVFLWRAPGPEGTCTVCAVRDDGRTLTEAEVEDLVIAAEPIAISVASRFPVKGGILAWFTREKVDPGGYVTAVVATTQVADPWMAAQLTSRK